MASRSLMAEQAGAAGGCAGLALHRPARGTGSAESEALIRMRGIVKVFHTPAGDFPALRGIDVDFAPGEFVSVVGRSGSGKSTLANMITGIDRPTEGTVWVNGSYVQDLGESAMARWRGRNLGIVFQFNQLLPTLSLLENVMLPMDIGGVLPWGAREGSALALLRLVGLEGAEDKLPAAVSAGQQQCAAIARAMANDPPIVIADEPTGNLDSRMAETVFALFEGLVARGRAVIMVTHDPLLAQRTTRSLHLADGRIVPSPSDRVRSSAAVGCRQHEPPLPRGGLAASLGQDGPVHDSILRA